MPCPPPQLLMAAVVSSGRYFDVNMLDAHISNVFFSGGEMAAQFYMPEEQPYLWRSVRIRDKRGRLTCQFKLALRRMAEASRCDDDVSVLMEVAMEPGMRRVLLPIYLLMPENERTMVTA